jgi:Abortive infection alpha
MNDTNPVLSSGSIEKLTDLFHSLAGPLLDEVGLMLGDKVRVYRVRNLIQTVQKTKSMLRDAGLMENAVHPRLFLPIVEGCSVEDNETLQDMWAGLLASASQHANAVSPSFVETLKQLTPDEAIALQRVFENTSRTHRRKTVAGMSIPPYELQSETFERLGFIRRQYVLRNIPTGEEALNPEYGPHPDPEVAWAFEFTRYTDDFLGACLGPRKHP